MLSSLPQPLPRWQSTLAQVASLLGAEAQPTYFPRPCPSPKSPAQFVPGSEWPPHIALWANVVINKKGLNLQRVRAVCVHRVAQQCTHTHTHTHCPVTTLFRRAAGQAEGSIGPWGSVPFSHCPANHASPAPFLSLSNHLSEGTKSPVSVLLSGDHLPFIAGSESLSCCLCR
jgi:hypothetical protein